MSEAYQRSPLLPEDFTMPAIPTFSIDTCRVPPLSHCGVISLSFHDEPEAEPVNVADYIQRFANAVIEGIRNVVQAIADIFNSPQVRKFFKQLAIAARRAGIIEKSKVPARRKQRSTKRARIYQRKMQCKALTAL